ncbi:MAG: hypothetical protein WCB94_00030 [Terriglobales bacterium]
MNLTKTAAILVLMVALAAAGYLLYLSTLVRGRYEKAASSCATCTAVKEAVASNWRSVESSIELLKAQKKYREAEKVAQQHAGERPVSIDVPCSDCEMAAPDYSTPTTVVALGLLAAAVLFGAVKPART